MSEILKPDGTPAKAESKHNLLILTGGEKPYQEWQEDVDRLTPKKDTTQDVSTGFDETLDYELPQNNLTPAERTMWPRSLPPEFCPLCDKFNVGLSISKGKCLMTFMKPYPGIDVKVGDTVEVYFMDKCFRAYVNDEDAEHTDQTANVPKIEDDGVIDTESAPTFRSDQRKSKALVVEERIVAYIQSRYLSGDRDSAIFGSESRKERFAHREEI